MMESRRHDKDDNDDNMDVEETGDDLTTREKIASAVGLFVPSPRVIGNDRIESAEGTSKEGVRTRRMCKELEGVERERSRERQAVSISRASTPPLRHSPTTAVSGWIDRTPSTPSTPASQIMRHDAPLEAPGAPRKTRLMRIHPEEWAFASQVVRRLDIFDDDSNGALQRYPSSENDSRTEHE